MGVLPSIVCRKATFDGSRTWIVGVINVTPDSFSDGGRFASVDEAVAVGARLAEEGADLIDVGGESTRPGSAPVPVEEERDRVLPVIEKLAARVAVPISIDTYKAEVAAAAIGAGAEVVNDVSGGALDPGMYAACARARAPLVVGHLRGRPETMQQAIDFRDVVGEVGEELAARIAAARAAGVEQLVADPGLGFGKTAAQSLALLARAGELGARLGVPIMVGPSRKSFLGTLSGRPASERLAPTIAACVAAALDGARFVRVHDVADTRAALAVADAIARARAEAA